ncbi:MAG: Phosphoglucosamine mutase [Candidatus Ozemobacter sibiricus]|jgi:phosphoglucosamine mutase|uniref:Phosphoglucosamine mutase n=1 Tax=Candidatus Ozemobacter sibiricus TaxID=2268124 RepID=A0A367ZPN7_9BACT|nr:MAG: Phosphoglucosamine mutase [Candidatus Ozemobacter sibiricus]
MGRLFGTDGVRGVANQYPLNGETAFRIAQLATRHLLDNHKKHQRPMFIGKDTRLSSDFLEHAVAAGVASVGAEARLLGVVPTPAVAYLTRELQGMGGIMISASHNPFPDNGIKIFSPDGYKIPDAMEEAIEADLAAGGTTDGPTGKDVGRIVPDTASVSFWLSSLAKVVGEAPSTRRLKVAIDCANGALAPWAPKFFADLGFSVDAIGITPNGTNINDRVGSTHIQALAQVMAREHFDIGFAFDGDADRVIAMTTQGDVIDGDYILAIVARYLKQQERLPGNALVTTVMANLGLDMAMKNLDIKIFKTKVGDRFVLEEMKKTQTVVGGEQSGHIILADYATTGDGLLTACFLLKVMRATGATLKELSEVMSKLPQVLVNIRVKNKNFEAVPQVLEEIRSTERRLSGRGRLLVRPSGTENLVRVMAEGPDEKEIRHLVDGLAKVISAHLC